MPEYPHCTFTATPICSSHSSAALYETYVIGQRNLDGYIVVPAYLVLIVVYNLTLKWSRGSLWTLKSARENAKLLAAALP